jgi:hypothetical protein
MDVGSPKGKTVKNDSAADFAAFQGRFADEPANTHQYNASRTRMRSRFGGKSDGFAIGQSLAA